MAKYRNRLLAGFAIAFGIYIVLLLFTNTGDLIAHLRAFPWILLVPLVALKLLSWVFRFSLWHYYLGVVGARDKLSLADSAIIFISGFMFVISPGKMGQALKAVFVKAKTGVAVAAVAPIILAESINDGLGILAITLIGVALAGKSIDLGPYRSIIALSTAAILIGVIAVQIRPLGLFLIGLCGRLPLIRRAQGWLLAFYDSTRVVLLPQHLLIAATLDTIAYTIDSVALMLIISGFGVPISWTLFLQSMFIQGVTSALGALSGSPNGAGVTEISSSGMLLALVAPANPILSVSAALAAAVIEGFFQKWFRVLAGLVVTLIFRKRLFTREVDQMIASLDFRRPSQAAAELGD